VFWSMIDLHCHVLAGIDDGPETIAGSLALARLAADLGTRTIVATPHVSWRYDNDSATIARLVRETNVAIGAAGIALEVIPGAEVAMTRVPELAASELKALTLGGGPWLLLECPFSSVSVGFDTAVFELEEQGYRIVLAHPERCQGFHRDPEMLEELIRGGVLASITAGSLIGSFGERVRRFALGLVEAELVHNVASDAHDPEKRPPSIAAELERSGLGALAEWMTEAVPAAILAGEQRIPPRPSVSVAIEAGARGQWWQRGPLRRA
jgi:protein-tyrosine phosphatase